MDEFEKIEAMYATALWELTEVSVRLRDMTRHNPGSSYWDPDYAVILRAFLVGINTELNDVVHQLDDCWGAWQHANLGVPECPQCAAGWGQDGPEYPTFDC